MDTSKDSATPKLDVDVWADFDKNLFEVQDRLRDQGLKGLFLAGPETVSMEVHRTIPFIGFRLYDTVEEAAVDFRRGAVAVTMRLDSNEVFAAHVFIQRDDHRSAPVVPPRPAYVVQQFSFNLRAQAEDLPWQKGDLLTTVLLFDRRSNRVRTRLSKGAAAERDPAVVEFLQKNRRPDPPAEPVFPRLPAPTAAKGALPVYAPMPGTPPIPAQPEIALAVERVVVTPPDGCCILRGSFKLPALAREIVGPAPPTGTTPSPSERAYRDVGDPRATAVVPISLVLLGSLDPGPYVVRLRVPSYTPIPKGAGHPIVEGSFNLDLFSIPGMPHLPQTYQVWAFSGETLLGPVPVSTVTGEMLRSE